MRIINHSVGFFKGFFMNIKKLEAAVKTYELKSISLASQELGLTQSAVSHSIADLEEELGFQILTRTRKGVYLTPQGERILPHMKAILNDCSLMLQEADSIRGVEEGTVIIGTFSSVAVHLLPGILKSFEQDYPKIEFRLKNGDYHDVEEWIARGEVDIGFVSMPASVPCITQPLFEDRLLAILPKEHPLASLDVLPLKLIENEPFIGLLETSNQDARNAVAKAGVRLNVKYNTKDDYAVIAMVENGLGMSIMPELLLKGRHDDLLVLPLVPEAKRVIGIAVAAGENAGLATRKFTDYVVRYVKEQY